jgi:hypothetical protein
MTEATKPDVLEPKRPKKYIWVTWITKLISGEDKCWYKAWHKATYKYEKRADDADRADFFAEWQKKHDAITTRRVAELRKQGWVVKVEEEGEFKLAGKNADVSGKPDYVAMKDGVALVGDAKSGKKRESDHWQVLIYAFALPLSWLRGSGLAIEGEVEYQDQRQPVRPLTDAARKNIVEAIQRIAGPAELPAAPSITECKFCDVAKCKYRVESMKRADGDATSFF